MLINKLYLLMIVYIVFIASLIGLGVLFSFGKGAFLIGGCNTLSEKGKSAYDSAALCKFMGKLMLTVTGCVLCFGADHFFPGLHLFAIGQFFLIAILLWALIYANTKGRFKIKNKKGEFLKFPFCLYIKFPN